MVGLYKRLKFKKCFISPGHIFHSIIIPGYMINIITHKLNLHLLLQSHELESKTDSWQCLHKAVGPSSFLF